MDKQEFIDKATDIAKDGAFDGCNEALYEKEFERLFEQLQKTSSNNKYTAPQATHKSCKLCGGSPTEKRSGQNYCPYCESYF